MATSLCALCSDTLDAVDELLIIGAYEVVRCPNCGLVQRAERPSQDDLSELYASDYFVASEGTLGSQGYLDYLGDEQLIVPTRSVGLHG